MQQRACALVHEHTHDGVRMSGAKMIESVVLLFTDDRAPPMPGGCWG